MADKKSKKRVSSPVPVVEADGSKFYDENRKLSPADVKAGWDNEATYPGPPKPGETFRQGLPDVPKVAAGEVAAPGVDHGGDLIGAILHGLGLTKKPR